MTIIKRIQILHVLIDTNKIRVFVNTWQKEGEIDEIWKKGF